MVNAWPVFGEPRLVQRRAVPLVELKAVAGFRQREIDHQTVAGDLGDNRRSGDREGERIAVDGTELRQAEINDAGVDEERAGLHV